jgi:hypothetical protein
MSGQLRAPATLPWGKRPRYTMNRRSYGPQSRSRPCEVKRNLTPARNGTLAVQPVARCHIDWAIAATVFLEKMIYFQSVNIFLILRFSRRWILRVGLRTIFRSFHTYIYTEPEGSQQTATWFYPSTRICVNFSDTLFLWWGVLSHPIPHPYLENRPSSAVRDC